MGRCRDLEPCLGGFWDIVYIEVAFGRTRRGTKESELMCERRSSRADGGASSDDAELLDEAESERSRLAIVGANGTAGGPALVSGACAVASTRA